MNEENSKRNKFLSVLKVIKKRVRLSSVLMLLLTLSMNTYAWFIYATKVESGVTAYIKAWNVIFQVGEEEITEYIDFSVSQIYPGMPDFADSITVYNNGESIASLSYEIVSIKILDDVFSTDGTPEGSSALQSRLFSDYPFKITVGFSSAFVFPEMSSSFNIGVVWPYESGDDETDTYWGNQAYHFLNTNPDEPSISITIKISAVQSH